MSTTVFNEKLNERVTLTCESAYFTEKADINIRDFYGILVVSTVTPDARLILENNITVSSKTDPAVHGIVSDTSLSVSASNPKKTIKVTASDGEFSARGIESRQNLDLDDFSANINVSGVVKAYGFYAKKTLNAYRLSGKVTVSAKNSYDATAYGLYAYSDSGNDHNLTITKDISNVWNVTASGRTATAYGIISANGIMELGQISGKITVTATGTGYANACGIFDNCTRAVRSMILDSISGTITVKASGGSGTVYAYGVHSVAQLYATGDFNGNFTVSANAKSDANANARGIYSGNIYSAGLEDIVAGDIGGIWKITVKGSQGTQAYALSAEQDISLGNIDAKITVTETNTNKGNSDPKKHFTAALSAGEMLETGDIAGSITVTGTHASGLVGNKGIIVGDLADSTWKITAKNGSAYGVHAVNGTFYGGNFGKLTVSATGGDAYGVYAAESADFFDITGNKTITSKTGNASGFQSGSFFAAKTVSGNITVSGKGIANGFLSADSLTIDDMTEMNLKVTSSNDEAYGITSFRDIVMYFDALNTGRITVSGKQAVTGIYVSNNLYAANPGGEGVLTGTITATSKALYATGIEVNAFSADDGNGRITVGSTIKATGKTGAYGIILYEHDLALEGAAITAKTTSKDYDAYAVYTTDSSANTVSISGNSKLTGLIGLGDGTDVVTIESGSQLNGGLNSVEKLTLKINDSSQKNNAVWNATKSFNSVCNVSYDVEYGLTGKFKLITKKSDMNWSYIIDSQWWVFNNDLFSYNVYTEGNNLYLKATVREGLDTGVCYNEKLSSGEELTQDKVIFTDKANMTVKGNAFCYDSGYDLASAIDASYTTTLILDNNITVNSTNDEYAFVYGVVGETISIASASAAKTLKVTAKGYSLGRTGAYSGKKVTLLGKKFLQNITVSDVKTFGTYGYTYGIAANESLHAEGVIAGKFTISSKNTKDVNVRVFGIYTDSFAAEDISGQFKITGNSAKGTQTYGVSGGEITLKKLSGKFDLSSNGGESCEGWAIYASESITVEDGFSGKITVNVKNGGDAKTAAFSSDTALTLNGKNTGTISLNASGSDTASACALTGAHSVTLSNYSGAIAVKAVANKSSAYAGVIESMLNVTVYGDLASKLTVSAQSKNKTADNAAACGISSMGTITMGDISGVWNISASGYSAQAFGIWAKDDIIVGDISGSKTISATAKSSGSDVMMQTCGFYSELGTFSAGRISGNITATASETARGFYCKGDFSVDDMSKMNLKVTSKNDAYGIHTDSNIMLGNAGLNPGKITVNAGRYAYGLHIMNGMIKADSSYLNNVLSGNITVVSKTNRAIGIKAYGFDNVVCSATISTTGKNAAIGIDFETGDLTLDGAKITAKVTEKGDTATYAVYTMNQRDNVIELTGKSKLMGSINTGGTTDNDLVSIESGSKLVGALVDVENLELEINDAAQANNSMWDVIESDHMTQTQLWLDIDYGLTGEFLLATKKSSLDWDEVIDFGSDGGNIKLTIGEDQMTMTDFGCTYGDFTYAVEEDGNKLILTISDTATL